MITGYKIAIATSDGIMIDRSFGQTEKFVIFAVDKAGEYRKIESRSVTDDQNAAPGCSGEPPTTAGCSLGCQRSVHKSRHDVRVGLLGDCRVVLCTKVGSQARKMLEHKLIAVFDVEMSIDDALFKIIPYFERIDKHMHLERGLD